MDLKELMDSGQDDDVKIKGAINFATTVCVVMMAEVYKDKPEMVKAVQDELNTKIEGEKAAELKRVEDLDPMAAMLMGAMGGDEMSKTLERKYGVMLETVNQLFGAVDLMIKAKTDED